MFRAIFIANVLAGFLDPSREAASNDCAESLFAGANNFWSKAMKVDRSRALSPTAAIAGALALLSFYAAGSRHAIAREACAHCAAARGAIEVKDQTTALRVEIREWPTPTRNTHPHDPLATPDGAIWYAGQKANLLGRLDPAAGKIREYPLKSSDSGPHGLVADKSGAIWFTAQGKGYIGKLDPASGEVREYVPKSARPVDPHTPIFDRNGVLWFTAQSANLIGRLDPLTGEITLLSPPTKDSAPYGLVFGADGALYVAEFGANKIARLDPTTLRIEEFALPHEDARPRRIAATGDGYIWYTDFTRGRLGRLNPRNGEVVDWASPGGAQSGPYAIAALGDDLWYVETGDEQNMLVRFDPKTQGFERWPIPSGGGVVRNMVATPAGGLALACSGVDKIALVTISPAGK
jgi:virginiamycin B lyase